MSLDQRVQIFLILNQEGINTLTPFFRDNISPFVMEEILKNVIEFVKAAKIAVGPFVEAQLRQLGVEAYFENITGIDIALAIIISLLVIKFTQFLIRPRLMNVPRVEGGWPFLGQVFEMLKGSPWDVMTAWSHKYGGIYTFHLFGSDAICISDGIF